MRSIHVLGHLLGAPNLLPWERICPSFENWAINTAPRAMVEEETLTDHSPGVTARKTEPQQQQRLQFTARSAQDPSATIRERPRIPPDRISTTHHYDCPCFWFTCKYGLQRGILFCSVSIYSVQYRNHGLGSTSDMATIL